MRENATTDKIVNVSGLQKTFGVYKAVDDVSFAIEAGEVVGLLGPNGAGKSTTIQMLLGLIAPSAGRVEIFGMDPWRQRERVLQRANFSSAYVALPYNLKVMENLKVFAGLYGVKKPKEKIAELMEFFEISHLANKMTGGLSSGESTRLNLCKALLNDPDLLLLDEPTASLDPDIADKMRKKLITVQKDRGLTIIYTSHNMQDVHELCQRVLFLHKGKIIAEGHPDAILQEFGSESLEDLFISIARGGHQVP